MPATTIRVKDETFGGDVLRDLFLHFDSETATVRDIIERRVRTEVEVYNEKHSEIFQGLVQPTDTEKALNGFRVKAGRAIDAEQQVYIALEAFNKNGYFVLIDDRQAESLDEEVLLASYREISFVKLTPLVGG